MKGMSKRKQVVSLLSLMAMAFIGFTIFGLAVNWNLFVVVMWFCPILLVGLGIIFLPELLKDTHDKLGTKIDEKMTEYGKKIGKALSEEDSK